MKKILFLLSAFGITTTSISSVVACNSANSKLTEEQIYNKVKEIANEPIEYNDLFLVNYKAGTPEVIHKFFSTMLLYNKTSTNLINQLLTKLVYERVFKAIPNLEKFYPDFTLYAKIDLQDNVDEEMENLKQNRKFTTNYIILYNLHSLDQIDLFMGTGYKDGEKREHDFETTLRTFFEGGKYVNGQTAEYMVHAKETFSFKQREFINDDQQRLDFYMDLYQNSGHIKPFASDSHKNSLKMFNIADVKYQENDLPQNVVAEIKDNSPEKAKYLSIIEDYIKNQWLQINHIERLCFDELRLIDSFETNLTFDSAYTISEINDNQKLNYVFGTHDGHDGHVSGFYNGVLIFNLDLKVKFENKTSHQAINEKFYVRIV